MKNKIKFTGNNEDKVLAFLEQHDVKGEVDHQPIHGKYIRVIGIYENK